MKPFDWVGSAVRDEPQASRVAAVAAVAIRLGWRFVSVFLLALLLGIYAAFVVKVFLYGWRLIW